MSNVLSTFFQHVKLKVFLKNTLSIGNFFDHEDRVPPLFFQHLSLMITNRNGVIFSHNVVSIFHLANCCGSLGVAQSAPLTGGYRFESQNRCYQSHIMVQTISPYELGSNSLQEKCLECKLTNQMKIGNTKNLESCGYGLYVVDDTINKNFHFATRYTKHRGESFCTDLKLTIPEDNKVCEHCSKIQHAICSENFTSSHVSS